MKILMIGLGGIGQRHLRNIRQLYGDTVEIIAFRRRKLNHVLTDKLKIDSDKDLQEVYKFEEVNSLQAAIALKPNVCFICTPSSMHTDEALEMANSGCHLFIEKPIASSLKNLDKLLETIKQNNLITHVGYQLRFHPCYQKLKDFIDQKVIGKILSVNAEVGEFLPGWHTYEDYRKMYASRADQGGGVILSQIHELDYIYSLFGLPDSCYATGGHLSSLNIDVEDVASIIFNYKHFPVHVHMDYIQRPPSRNCKIIGDEGKIEMDFAKQEIKLFSSDGKLLEYHDYSDFQRNELFINQLKHFFECTEAKKECLVSAEDGTMSLKMALAAKASLNSGQVEKIK